jgi:hypothetical protein
VSLANVPYGGGGPWALTLWMRPGSLYGPSFEYLFSQNQSAPSPDVLPNQVRPVLTPCIIVVAARHACGLTMVYLGCVTALAMLQHTGSTRGLRILAHTLLCMHPYAGYPPNKRGLKSAPDTRAIVPYMAGEGQTA